MRNLIIVLLILAMGLVFVESQVNQPETPPTPEQVAAANHTMTLAMIPVLLVGVGAFGFVIWSKRRAWDYSSPDGGWVPAGRGAKQHRTQQSPPVKRRERGRPTGVTIRQEGF